MPFRILFQDLPHSDRLREDCEARANTLREQFPETLKYEVTLAHDGAKHEAHVRVTGKDIEMVSHSQQHELHDAIVEAFERLQRQLRKHHDKLIFSRRRDAQKNR